MGHLIQTVKAQSIGSVIDLGDSLPCTMKCLTQNDLLCEVVVKFKENLWGPIALVNELVAGLLAQKFQLPSPEPVLVYVSEELAHSINSTTILPNVLVTPGIHFGTIRVPTPFPQPTLDLILLTHNIDDFPRIIVFDTLVRNMDRNNPWNFLIVRPDFAPSRLYLSIIDHTHCFGEPWWDESILLYIEDTIINCLPNMAERIHGEDPFREAFEMFKILTSDLIKEILEVIPSEWGLPEPFRKALTRFLLERALHVEAILKKNIDLFPGWRLIYD